MPSMRAELIVGLFTALIFISAPVGAGTLPSVAFYYGDQLPLDELSAFDWVVLEPEYTTKKAFQRLSDNRVFAYVSVGEVEPSRSWMSKIPEAWILGGNPAWGSLVIDQSQSGWPAFFVDEVITPLWEQGFRGFFLDTLDSYHLYAKDSKSRAQQEAGQIKLIRTLKARYPEAKLFFNRGFEILPEVHELTTAVAAESLFAGWDPASGNFHQVSEADRTWLINKLNQVKNNYRIPVVAIDYLPPAERERARGVAEKIQALGFIPWVTNPELTQLGVGSIEVMPRKVLMLYNEANDETMLMEEESVVLYGTMPLNWLGYKAEYLNARDSLPEYPLTGRYAGSVIWLQKPLPAVKAGRLAEWMRKQAAAGFPILVLGNMDFLRNAGALQELGLQREDLERPARRLRLVKEAEIIGFETRPIPDRSSFFPLSIASGTPLAVVEDDRGRQQVAAAITPWGGYALSPFAVFTLPGETGDRWVIDPFSLMQQALRLPDIPVPDVTTESGRRMLLIHMDGDGFASRSEFPGNPYAAKILNDKIIKRYRVPTTISIIEGETSKQGQFPKLSAQLEPIARDILAQPHVEIGSHTFSHPYDWGRIERVEGSSNSGYNMPIPGYEFDLQREIAGSIHYIESRLAPPGKKVKLLQWSGNCNPTINALAETVSAGVVNINGGDTVMTRSLPTYTAVAPLGIQKGPYFQVYAPNQNENVYTNDWTGPFYGFRRVIETFEMTDTPRRLKPINIYYHTYAASKPPSLAALDEAYRWAIKQRPTPVFTSEYVSKVLDFNRATVARTANGWRIRGLRDLRQLRIPANMGFPDLKRSRGIAGYRDHNNQRYIHAGASEVDLVLTSRPQNTPYLANANAQLRSLEQSSRYLNMRFTTYVPLRLDIKHASRCTFSAEGRTLNSRVHKLSNGSHYTLDSHAKAGTPIDVRCTQ